jgi:hypothetical protein
MEKIMPSGLEFLSDQLMAIFEKLSYCSAIPVSTDYASLKSADVSANIGLQWIPKSTSSIFKKLPDEVRPA